jgi:hypothetical protein
MLTSVLRVSGVAVFGASIGYLLGATHRKTEVSPIPHTIAKQGYFDSASREPEFRESKSESGYIHSAAARVSRAEMEAVVNGLKNIPSMDERRRRFGEIVGAWAESDGETALTFARELPDTAGYLKIDAITTVARVLAAQNPAYLKRLVMEMPRDAIRQALILELARQGAKADLTQTLAWVEKLPQDRGRSEALRLLRSQLAHQDPEGATRVLDKMQPGFARQNLVGVIAAGWAFKDPQAAAQWAASLAAAEKDAAIPALAASWSQADPQAAGAFVAELPSGEMQERAAMSVMANWANQSPQGAGEWAMSFPEGRLRDLGVREVVNSWTSLDPNRAFEWVQQIPNTSTRDVALRSYAESVGYWSPEKAVTVTNLIQDQVQREAAIESVIRSWSEVDIEAAKGWLAKQHVRLGLHNRLSAFFQPSN